MIATKDMLSYIGAVTASYIALKGVYHVWDILRVYVFSKLRHVDLKKYGDWAGKCSNVSLIVTGT